MVKIFSILQVKKIGKGLGQPTGAFDEDLAVIEGIFLIISVVNLNGNPDRGKKK
ncbi:hypothetical protein [Neobacillus drentensis]|uniref:hypothetical protein n=1 Tax=Neobacillus drentensis TaxID=220684 RepID=UPI002FFD6360